MPPLAAFMRPTLMISDEFGMFAFSRYSPKASAIVAPATCALGPKRSSSRSSASCSAISCDAASSSLVRELYSGTSMHFEPYETEPRM
jgi:hypothetical protein